MAILSDSAPDLTPEEKLTKALEIAEIFSAGVKGPFVIKKLEGKSIDIAPALAEILAEERE